jgi:hypothetical protein
MQMKNRAYVLSFDRATEIRTVIAPAVSLQTSTHFTSGHCACPPKEGGVIDEAIWQI